VATLNRADDEATAAADAPAEAAEGDESEASPDVDDSELDYSDGGPSGEVDAEPVAA
jgi:hypothetical protein